MKRWGPTNVHFGLAIFGGPRHTVSGWKCSLHGVHGFAVHRGANRYQWRVSHVATGRLVIEGEDGQSREDVIAAAADHISERARVRGNSHDVGGFLQACIWHEAEGMRRYEEAVAAAEGVRA